MHAPAIFDPLIKAVQVADLRLYLLSKGWQIKPFNRQQVVYFEGPPDDEGKPLILLVPASEQLRDYWDRIGEIIAALAVIEQRPAGEILRNIVAPTCDVLHFRLDSEETRTGTLEFRVVERFFGSMRNLLVFAACGELRPQPFFQRALKQAARFADQSRLRSAPAASFRVDVETPIVPPAHESQVKLRAYPTERLILLSLMEGLGLLQQAVESGMTNLIFQQSKPRLNANMCEALLGMRPESSGGKLEVSISWSSTWPLDGQAPPETVTFQGKAFEQIDAIGRALRAGKEPQRRQLRGRVVRLSAEDPIDEGGGPLLAVLDIESANAPPHVEVALTPPQYRQACHAHLEGRPILVRGILDHAGRKWQLIDVVDFEVVQPESVP